MDAEWVCAGDFCAGVFTDGVLVGAFNQGLFSAGDFKEGLVCTGDFSDLSDGFLRAGAFLAGVLRAGAFLAGVFWVEPPRRDMQHLLASACIGMCHPVTGKTWCDSLMVCLPALRSMSSCLIFCGDVDCNAMWESIGDVVAQKEMRIKTRRKEDPSKLPRQLLAA